MFVALLLLYIFSFCWLSVFGEYYVKGRCIPAVDFARIPVACSKQKKRRNGQVRQGAQNW